MTALPLPRRVALHLTQRLATLKTVLPNIPINSAKSLGDAAQESEDMKAESSSPKHSVSSSPRSSQLDLLSLMIDARPNPNIPNKEIPPSKSGNRLSSLSTAAEATGCVLPKSFLGDFPSTFEGVIPFRATEGSLKGALLIDRTLHNPVQVISLDVNEVDESYVRERVDAAFGFVATLSAQGLLDTAPRSAFRLIHNAAAGLPGINVDLYADYALVHLYSKHWDRYIHTLANALMKNQHRTLSGVYLTSHLREEDVKEAYYTSRLFKLGADKESDKLSALSVCIAGQRAEDHSTTVEERGALYRIKLNNGSATGLYLDQRDNRKRIAEILAKLTRTSVPEGANFVTSLEKQPKIVAAKAKATSHKEGPVLLNPFAFTSSFTLAAAQRNRQLRSLNLDLSHASLRWAKMNFTLSGVPQRNSLQHTFWTKEVFRGLYSLMKTSKLFDVVLLDPPTLSRIRVHDRAGLPSNLDQPRTLAEVLNDADLGPEPSPKSTPPTHKRKESPCGELFTFSTLENYSELSALGAALVAPGGFLVTFCNTQGLARNAFLEQLREGFDVLRSRKAIEIAELRLLSTRRSLRFKGFSKKKADEKLAEKLKLKRLSPKEGANTEVLKRFQPSAEELKILFDFEQVEELFPSIDFRPRALQRLALSDAGVFTASESNSEALRFVHEDESLSRALLGFVWRRKAVSPRVHEAIVRGEFKSLKASELVADVGDDNDLTYDPNNEEVNKTIKKEKVEDEKLVAKVVSFHRGTVTTKEDL